MAQSIVDNRILAMDKKNFLERMPRVVFNRNTVKTIAAAYCPNALASVSAPTLSVGKRFGNSQEKKTFITMPVIAPNMGTYTFILEYMMRLNISIVQ